ncbi:ABC transporter permease [Nonlabens antarcticus]|uniref:ABC transporter permease n=1 Tax=Nonlabens antarcticus TaxID=392714 RepID=UPI0018919934|nr:ABC transporter permease [Nonlabens antarcticus]
MAWRALRKNKLFSVINILGLSVGLCACLSVATVVVDDLSYDSHWKNKDNIYRLLSIRPTNGGSGDKMASSFAGLEYALPENFPEIKTVVNLRSGTTNFKISKENDDTTSTTILDTSIKIWDVLDFNILQGSPQNFVEGTTNLVITKTFKDTYFPNSDPVGIIINDAPTYGATPDEYLITGIIEDIPANTHLRAQAIVIKKSRVEQLVKEQYGTTRQYYMTTKAGTDITALTKKVNAWYKDFIATERAWEYDFQPIEDVYLHSDFETAQEVQGDYNTIFILSGISILLLIIACINFINLSASRSMQRIKEVGVRKILGAGNRAIIRQFLVEAILYFAISTIMATIVYYLTLPLLESFIGHELQQTFASDLQLLAMGYGVVLLVSIFVGLYPALLMSKLKAAASLKGSLKTSGANFQSIVQKGLVTFQFAISTVVLIALIVVDNQVSFMKNKDLGYNTENLLAVSNISWDNKADTFKDRLLRIPGITNASITSFLPGTSSTYMTKKAEDPFNKDQFLEVDFIRGDADLPVTLGLKLKTGRLFNKEISTDTPASESEIVFDDDEQEINLQSSLISEYTSKALDIKNLNTPIHSVETNPIGILKDFHNESLRQSMSPTVIIAESNPQYGGMLIRLDPEAIQQALPQLQTLWKEIYPVKLLDLNWVDETVQRQYLKETRLQQFFSFFSGLSMLLAALGILGLIAQATALRMKEIGIRKVLGASVSNIVLLFSKDFIKLIGIAALIGAPISYYFVNEWLLGFAYRTSVSWWVFVAAAAITLIVALLTIAVQTIKAAIANPVDSLKIDA